MTDAAAAQNTVQLRVEKAAVARFRQHHITGQGLQLIDQLIIPAAFSQQLALQLRTTAHGLQGVRFVVVRRPRATGFHILLVPAVLEPDDRHSGGASRGDGGFNVVDNRPGGGDVKSGEVEIPSLAGIGVLHIDDDQRAVLRREGQGFRTGGKRNHQATSRVTVAIWSRQRISG